MNFTHRPNANLQVSFDASSSREAFKILAELDETFGVTHCGDCKSEDIRFVVRKVDDNNFPEMKCGQCFAKLAFGQSKDGKSIYPRIRYHKEHPAIKAGKAETGDPIPKGGWERFSKSRDDQD